MSTIVRGGVHTRALILAAGVGSRLCQKTPEHLQTPKALLEFGGKSLLARHVEILRGAGITSITVIIGFAGETVRAAAEDLLDGPPVSLLVNPDFREGSVVSLCAGREVLRSGDPVILMDADVLYDRRLMARLVDSVLPNCLLLDREIEPGDEPVKLCVKEGRIVDFNKRPSLAYEWHGESVGFFPIFRRYSGRTRGSGRAVCGLGTPRTGIRGTHPRHDHCKPFRPLWLRGHQWSPMDRNRLPRRRGEGACIVFGTGRMSMLQLDLPAASREPTPEECAQMERDGYLVVRDFFGAEETRDILRWTCELEAAPELPGRHWVYHEDSVTEPGRRLIQRIENFCPFHHGFDRLIRAGALTRWAGALMGGPVVLFKEKINFKMAGGPGFKPHQDQQAGWTRYAPLFITALVTIDPATLENGCLEIVPGRHREGLIGEEWKPLDEGDLSLRPLPTAPGDAIFFDSFVPHASKPNFTDLPRRLLYLTYNLASVGDHRAQYYADKHASFPPDVDRDGSKSYVFRV